jgi:CRP/FNR family transcriptional regulator
MLVDNNEYREAFDVLSSSKLFGSISDELLASMLTETKIVYLKKRAILDNNFGTKHLYILLSGRLKVTQIDPLTGRSIAPFLLKEGDVFDFFSLLDGKEHTVFPVALDDIVALSISLDRAREWIYDYPEFNKSFMPYLGEKMRELESFGSSIVFDDIVTRLSKLILRYASPKKMISTNLYPVKIIHNLSDESISEMIGSVRSVVSSQINKLKEENLIFSTRGKLSIKNLEGLIKKCDVAK